MLSMGAMSAGQANYYLSLAKEDYYLEGGEPPGTWHGRGALRLDLSGKVLPDQLYNLFDGLAPDGSSSLVRQRASNGNHRPGWDLTFSAPKSVSVFWSQAPDSMRFEIQNAQREAVASALAFLEGFALYTRRGHQGQELEKVGMVAALFEHSTSRALDPQLHTHALVLNVGIRDDQTTGSVSSFHLFLSKMLAGALYRVELANQLENRLGLQIERNQTWFELTGVDAQLINHFSKRRQTIVSELRRKGMTSAEAAAVVAIETRSSKDGISRPELFERWKREGHSIGWSTKEAEGLAGNGAPARNPEEESVAALSRATEHLSSNSAHFTFRDFARAFAEESQGRGFTASKVIEAATEHLTLSNDIVRLGFFDGEQRYTTVGMFELERQLLDDSHKLHLDDHHRVSAVTLTDILVQHEELSEEQIKATLHIAQDTGAIAIASGMAGTGKTRMLATAKEAWEAEGYRVIGTSVAARAARQLQDDAGIPSQTMSKLLHDIGSPTTLAAYSDTLDQFEKRYGPDVLEPIRGLAKNFGPDILDPLRRILDEHGPNILEPFQAIAEKYGPNVLEPFQSILGQYGPNIGQAWRSLAGHFFSKVDGMGTHPVLDRNTIVVADEAGMIATPELALLTRACSVAGAKLVLIGDERQLQPIGPGAPFSTLGDEFGKAVLTDIRRQREEWEKKAIKEFATGRAREAIREYAARGLVSVSGTRDEAMQTLVDQWQTDALAQRDTLILAGTRKEVSDLNRLAQEKRRAAGELGDQTIDHGGEQFYLGDQVVFSKNSRPRGVENGARGQVVSITEENRTITVKLESGNQTTISLDDFRHVSLGYATTTHKAQGATVSNAYVLVGGHMQDRELSYVQASRARETTRFYTTQDEAGDELTLLARDMERSRQKQLAHAIASGRSTERGLFR